MFDLMFDHFAKSKKIIQRDRDKERERLSLLLKLVLDRLKESRKPIVFHILKTL